MTRRMAVAALVVAGNAAIAAADEAPEGGPGIAVVESFRITGGFRARRLDVNISGRVVGHREAFPILSKAGGARIFGCEGAGLLTRRGEFVDLLPFAPTFHLHCRLAPSDADRIELTTTQQVLWAESAVGDGDATTVDQPDGSRTLTISAHQRPEAEMTEAVSGAPARNARPEVHADEPAAQAVVIPPAAEGRYLVSLRPGRADFKYRFDVRNPNPTEQTFSVEFHSGEVVQHSEGARVIESNPGIYSFALSPGDARIVLTGALPEAKFVAPLPSGAQYLLVEAHPLLRVTLPERLRRISPGETGMTAEFRGPQAFLMAAGEAATWEAKTVELLQTSSFAVPRTTNDFYLNADGEVLGDTVLEIQNEGASDISLPMKATPAAAFVDGAAVPLTKNASGNFWTQLSVGMQGVAVQHWQHVREGFGLAWGTLWLPEVPASVTETSVSLHYPREWTPLVQRFHGETRIATPTDGALVLAGLLGLWALIVATGSRLSFKSTVAIVVASAASALTERWAVAAVILCHSALTIMWTRASVDRIWKLIQSAGELVPSTVVVGGMLLLIGMGFTSIFGEDVRALFGAATQSLSGSVNVTNHAVNGNQNTNTGYNMKSLAAFAMNEGGSLSSTSAGNGSANDPAGSEAAPHRTDYVGVSARTEPPVTVKLSSFHAEMLKNGGATGVSVLLLSTSIVRTMEFLAGLIVLFVFVRERMSLLAAAQRLWSAGHPVESGPAPLPVAAM